MPRHWLEQQDIIALNLAMPYGILHMVHDILQPKICSALLHVAHRWSQLQQKYQAWTSEPLCTIP